jgi:hypothetical protein
MGPANRALKVNLQGKEGLTKEEFETVRGNRDKINELLRKKLNLDDDLIRSDEKPGTLDSLPALNLLIGKRTKLKLTSEQFEQTQGNEKQARQKAKVNKDIEKVGEEKEAEENRKARQPIIKRLEAIGLSDDRDEKVEKARGMGVKGAYLLSDEDLDALVLGDMSVEDAIAKT